MEIVQPQPSSRHEYTVVFLHGRDSCASEFAPEFFESQASDDRTLPEIFPQVKWVFPTAKILPSARFDMEMSQWFDMWSTEDPYERQNEQQDELDSTVSVILQIIKEEAAIVGGPQNIILGGISQGCASAIHALLRQEARLAGFIGLSSWLPLKETIANTTIGTTSEMPALLAHCEDDGVIAVKYGEELRDVLAGIGMEVEWCQYEDGGHWVNEPQGIDDIARFMHRVLPVTG
ncbi:hypothetical protein LTR37_021032 [Vermiconidia calcicola]|uniref:Uncharacterized protein n=1 Tax=Vermiconidia calcicola TaxID=1690605 RepID=A0ACC3M9Q1_9PEZI|nr:hypothetical protein LTR37_021032 [Vermiconidia calcicola]